MQAFLSALFLAISLLTFPVLRADATMPKALESSLAAEAKEFLAFFSGNSLNLKYEEIHQENEGAILKVVLKNPLLEQVNPHTGKLIDCLKHNGLVTLMINHSANTLQVVIQGKLVYQMPASELLGANGPLESITLWAAKGDVSIFMQTDFAALEEYFEKFDSQATKSGYFDSLLAHIYEGLIEVRELKFLGTSYGPLTIEYQCVKQFDYPYIFTYKGYTHSDVLKPFNDVFISHSDVKTHLSGKLAVASVKELLIFMLEPRLDRVPVGIIEDSIKFKGDLYSGTKEDFTSIKPHSFEFSIAEHMDFAPNWVEKLSSSIKMQQPKIFKGSPSMPKSTPFYKWLKSLQAKYFLNLWPLSFKWLLHGKIKYASTPEKAVEKANIHLDVHGGLDNTRVKIDINYLARGISRVDMTIDGYQRFFEHSIDTFNAFQAIPLKWLPEDKIRQIHSLRAENPKNALYRIIAAFVDKKPITAQGKQKLYDLFISHAQKRDARQIKVSFPLIFDSDKEHKSFLKEMLSILKRECKL